jgi:GNAT superfamily N-acetyltransferase
MIELLASRHNRSDFDCGKEPLTNYLKVQAGQDIKRKLSVCYVLSAPDTSDVFGYYTLSSFSIPLSDIPESLRKKLPRSYTSIPTTLLGRLAVDRTHHGKGFGKILLMDALKRSLDLSDEIASFAVVVDPIDDDAERFYASYDFIKLPDSGKMFIAMKTLDEVFQGLRTINVAPRATPSSPSETQADGC